MLGKLSFQVPWPLFWSDRCHLLSQAAELDNLQFCSVDKGTTAQAVRISLNG